MIVNGVGKNTVSVIQEVEGRKGNRNECDKLQACANLTQISYAGHIIHKAVATYNSSRHYGNK